MKQRDIILVPFPFSDQTGNTIRPALVVSNNDFNKGQDLVLCAITSVLKKEKYAVDISKMEKGTLRHKSSIRTSTLLKMAKSRVIKTIGSAKPETFHHVRGCLTELFKKS